MEVKAELKRKQYRTKQVEGKNQKLKGKAKPPKKKEDKDKVVPTTQPRRSTRKKNPKK